MRSSLGFRALHFGLCASALFAAAADARPKRPSAKEYANTVRSWHTPIDAPERDAKERPRLVLRSLQTHEACELEALAKDGGFRASDLDRAANLLRDGTGATYPVEPQLINLVYQLQRAFDAREIRVLSGYRAPRGPTRKKRPSNHALGRAIDLVVPGASDEQVADYARHRGFVGVGIYPTSGFVHIDVRPRSYFWIDRSGPGKRNRERGILGSLALQSDQSARERGERPVAGGASIANLEDWLKSSEASASDGIGDEDDDVEADPS